MAFVRVNPGDPVQSVQIDQLIDCLNGVASKGQPIQLTQLNDATNYAETVQNLEATNSRALNVLKSDGTTLIKADVTGVTLGSPLNLPTNSITSTYIADGTIQNVDLGPSVARANLLVNPGFEIWQRGTGPYTANSVYSADRWLQSLGASSTISVSRSGTGPYALQATYTHAATTQIIQKLEDINQLKGTTISFSVDVTTSTANAVRVLVWDATSALGYSGYHTGNGSVQRLSSTLTVSGTATQVQVYLEFGASCTATFDNAMLVSGSQAANYVPLHPADDLARCMRYYEKMGDGNYFPMFWGYQGAGQTIYSPLEFKAKKAIAPTVTINGTFNTANASGLALTGTNVDGATFQFTATATGGAWIGSSAAGQNITIEANP